MKNYYLKLKISYVEVSNRLVEQEKTQDVINSVLWHNIPSGLSVMSSR